jgi:phytoene/squalene synthetase
MISIFHQVSNQCSKIVTEQYSTSFASAIRLLHKDLRAPIHNIYGFVRLADEIVDTFHDFDKEKLLNKFEEDTWAAIKDKISLNPILHSFQQTVHQYSIPHNLINGFLNSMRMDLNKSQYYNETEINEYIYGSAEVVGLMCLFVFCEGDIKKYEALKEPAKKLGAAFQKINFLRDIRTDFNTLNRSYFPNFNYYNFTASVKEEIEHDIENDFIQSLDGIRKLPWKARFGVYTAYRYYYSLFKKIQSMKPKTVLEQRIRIADYKKLLIILTAGINNRLNLI